MPEATGPRRPDVRSRSTLFLVSEMPQGARPAERFPDPLVELPEERFRLTVDRLRRQVLGVLDDPAEHRQDDFRLDFFGPSVLIQGASGSGKTHFLNVAVRQAIACRPETVLLVNDLAGGELLSGLTGAAFGNDELRLGPITLAHDQVLEILDRRIATREFDAEPILYVIDGLDLLWSMLEGVGLGRDRWVRNLLRLIEGGSKHGVSVVASATFPNREVSRAFRRSFTFGDASFGRAGRISLESGAQVQIAREVVPTWSPPTSGLVLGAPSSRDALERAGSLESIPVGQLHVSRSVATIDLSAGFAVLGPPKSGRTSLLALIARQIAAAAGHRIPVLSNAPSSELTSLSIVERIELGETKPEISGLFQSLWQDKSVARFLLIDDVRHFETRLKPHWPEIEALGVVPVVSAFPTETLGAMDGWRGMQKNLPNQIVLQPQNIGAEAFERVVRRPDAVFPPGSGVLRFSGQDYEVTCALPTAELFEPGGEA